MNHNHRRTSSRYLLSSVALVVVVAVLLSAVGISGVRANQAGPAPVPAPAQNVVTVRVGTVPVMIFAPLFVADAKGYFADENLAVEIMRNPGGSEPLAPLATGELEVVFGGAGAGLFNYANRNIELNGDPGFRIVAGVHSEQPPVTSPLVVSKARFDSGEITSVADLAGGRVAINAVGAATEYWMYQALQQGGVSLDEVELVAVAFPDVAAALNSQSEDRIDAAILGEPLVSFAELEGLVVRLSTDFIDGFQATFLYMSTDFIENNREAAIGFVKAYVRAARDLAGEDVWASDEIAAILEQYTTVPADINKNAARPYFPVNGAIDTEDLEILQEYFLERGSLGYTELLDVTVMLDASLLDEVLADIGEVEEEAPAAEPTPEATEEAAPEATQEAAN